MSRKIDQQVAEDVMGLKTEELINPDGKHVALITYAEGDRDNYRHVKNYSTSIADAWTVLEYLKFDFDIERSSSRFDVKLYSRNRSWDRAESKSAPMAICLAALKAKGVDVEGLEGND